MCTIAAKSRLSRRAAFLLLLTLQIIFQATFAFAAETPFGEAASRLGAEVFADPVSGVFYFIKDGKTAAFKAGSQVALFDGKPVVLKSAPGGNPPALTEEIFSEMQDFFTSASSLSFYRVGAILIDPGHGGKDPGASGSYTEGGTTITVREKDVTLSVGQRLYEMLSAKYPDKQILMTRTDDSYPSLEDRVNMANSVELARHEAIIYVSVHANAAFNKNSSGFEVWYLSPDYRRTVIDEESVDAEEILPILNSMMEEEFTTESILIAKSILDGLEAEIGDVSNNRGLKAESWFVVRNAKMPSVLIELGFVTNEKEARLLNDSATLQKYTTGIYNGIVNFVSYFESMGGSAAR